MDPYCGAMEGRNVTSGALLAPRPLSPDSAEACGRLYGVGNAECMGEAALTLVLSHCAVKPLLVYLGGTGTMGDSGSTSPLESWSKGRASVEAGGLSLCHLVPKWDLLILKGLNVPLPCRQDAKVTLEGERCIVSSVLLR